MNLSLEICTGTICINNNQFTIHENDLADSDITILKKIERIIRKNLIYETSSPQDKYATFSKEEMWEKLKKDTKVISDKYDIDLLCAEIKSEVLNIVSQIENHFKRSLFILPQDMLQYIFSFLKIKDLLQVAKVNKIGSASTKQALEQRMKLFGFKEDDYFFQKKNFLNLFKIVPYMLAKDGFKNFATYNLDSTLNIEETFKRIKDDVNIQTANGYTALHFAVTEENLELVNTLLNYGVDVNLQTTRGYTALHFAVIVKNQGLINTLLNHSAEDLNGALYSAVSIGDLELVNILLNHSDNLDLNGALQCAVDIEIVETLLKHGVDVNLQTEDGYALLQSVAQDGNLEFVKFLLNHGADINLQAAIDGSSPLHLAAENNHLDIVEFLIKNGADRSLKDKKGNTPLQLAEAMGAAQELIDLLKLTS